MFDDDDRDMWIYLVICAVIAAVAISLKLFNLV